jgi:hypothetical protein
MIRKLLMISAAALGTSFAPTAMTFASMKTHAHDFGLSAHMTGPGACRWCNCLRYVFRGNGICGRCGHTYYVHGSSPGLR